MRRAAALFTDFTEIETETVMHLAHQFTGYFFFSLVDFFVGAAGKRDLTRRQKRPTNTYHGIRAPQKEQKKTYKYVPRYTCTAKRKRKKKRPTNTYHGIRAPQKEKKEKKTYEYVPRYTCTAPVINSPGSICWCFMTFYHGIMPH